MNTIARRQRNAATDPRRVLHRFGTTMPLVARRQAPVGSRTAFADEAKTDTHRRSIVVPDNAMRLRENKA
jgi:hypothetical protein